MSKTEFFKVLTKTIEIEQNKSEIISIRRTLIYTGTREGLAKQFTNNEVKDYSDLTVSGQRLVIAETEITELPEVHESYNLTDLRMFVGTTLWGRLKICWHYLLRNGNARCKWN